MINCPFCNEPFKASANSLYEEMSGLLKFSLDNSGVPMIDLHSVEFNGCFRPVLLICANCDSTVMTSAEKTWLERWKRMKSWRPVDEISRRGGEIDYLKEIKKLSPDRLKTLIESLQSEVKEGI
jgi:hypothetical protein